MAAQRRTGKPKSSQRTPGQRAQGQRARDRRSAVRAPAPPRGPAAAELEEIRSMLEPVIADAGWDCESITLSPAGRRSLVRVVVDGDRGVGLDDIADISRQVSAVLDDHDPFAGRSPYVLEVTSPGVDRPLSEPRHWRRSIGRLVNVELRSTGSEPAPTVTGRVRSADDVACDLLVDGSRRRLCYDTIRAARVEIEFSHSEAAGDDAAEMVNDPTPGGGEQ